MALDLSGKVALVTGSTRGIGLAIAQFLSDRGCNVALNGRSREHMATAAHLLPHAIQVLGDVSIPAEAQRAVNRVLSVTQKLDILVCNVGSGSSVAPGFESYDEWQRVFAKNLWSTTNSVEAAKDALVASKGVVVCTSSICGLEVVPNAPVTYSAAKAALHAYVRGIARPLGPQGVRINAIAAGNIMSEDSVWSRRLSEDADAVQRMLERDVSIGRLGLPNEVAELVGFLVSSRSKFATGSVWTLDGGQARA